MNFQNRIFLVQATTLFINMEKIVNAVMRQVRVHKNDNSRTWRSKATVSFCSSRVILQLPRSDSNQISDYIAIFLSCISGFYRTAFKSLKCAISGELI